MSRMCVLAAALMLFGAQAVAQPAMKPTAPQKMMSPAEKQKLQDCQRQAADQNVKMDDRAKFVMDCMTKK